MASQNPPLKGTRVLEFAGLAPGPFAGLLLADYGASVLRIDRPHPSAHSNSANPPPPSGDVLVRHKTSICLDLKNPSSHSVFLNLLPKADVVIDPFRPGVLERLGLDPETVLLKKNPRLIVARMTGFRRDGKYKDMAGHDINYLAVSGILSMLGPPAPGVPLPPGNILGDFAGGGAMCFLGILLALLAREKSGKGQVVEANMVDGVGYLSSMPRLSTKNPMWDGPRGTNMLDGACPYYGTYATKDAKVMSVGALEPQFYAFLLKGLGFGAGEELPPKSSGYGNREDKRCWPHMRQVFSERFRTKTRKEWEDIFDGTDACVAPVLELGELEDAGYEQKVPVRLSETPGIPFKSNDGGWTGKGLSPGTGGIETLKDWYGWQTGREIAVDGGALVWHGASSKL